MSLGVAAVVIKMVMGVTSTPRLLCTAWATLCPLLGFTVLTEPLLWSSKVPDSLPPSMFHGAGAAVEQLLLESGGKLINTQKVPETDQR